MVVLELNVDKSQFNGYVGRPNVILIENDDMKELVDNMQAVFEASKEFNPVSISLPCPEAKAFVWAHPDRKIVEPEYNLVSSLVIQQEKWRGNLFEYLEERHDVLLECRSHDDGELYFHGCLAANPEEWFFASGSYMYTNQAELDDNLPEGSFKVSDRAFGKCIPQDFAQNFGDQIKAEYGNYWDNEIGELLAGPTHPLYWTTFEMMLSSICLTDSEKNSFHLEYKRDLWAVPRKESKNA